MTEKQEQKGVRATYRPGRGEPKTAEVFGRKVRAGETIDLPAEFANKARGNPHFSVEGEKTFGDDRQEAPAPEPQEEASFVENQRAAHLEEYRTTDPQQVDRIRRAREHSQELAAAKASPDRDEPAAVGDDDTDDAADEAGEDDDITSMTVPELREYAQRRNIDLGDATKKADIIKAIDAKAK